MKVKAFSLSVHEQIYACPWCKNSLPMQNAYFLLSSQINSRQFEWRRNYGWKKHWNSKRIYSFTIQFIHNWNSIVHKWLREWSLPYPIEILNNIEWKRNVFLLMSSKIKPHTPDFSDQITMFRKEHFEFWYLVCTKCVFNMLFPVAFDAPSSN